MPASATMAAAVTAVSGKGYRRWLLFVLLCVCFINYADRSVVGAIAEPLRREFHLNDLQLGLLQGISFALLYSVLGIPVARLAEQHSRVRIIALATLVWSAMTALCATASSYLMLLAVRVGVGVGEAGFMSPATSLLGDHYDRQERSLATSIMMLGVPFGALVGALLGGRIAQSMGWRWAFIVMGVPGLVIAALVFLTLREPARGRTGETVEATAPSLTAVARQCWSQPAFRHVVMGGTLGGFGLHGLGQFLGVYFTRVHGLSYAAAGALYGAQTFLSVAGGLLIGGGLTHRLGREDARWYALIPAIGMFGSVPLYLAGFQARGLAASATLIILAGVSLVMHYGSGVAIVQNLATPRTRASCVAFYLLFVNVVAMGLGPPLIGWLSDLFAARITGPGATAEGLTLALMTSTVLYAWGGVHYLLARRGLEQPA